MFLEQRCKDPTRQRLAAIPFMTFSTVPTPLPVPAPLRRRVVIALAFPLTFALTAQDRLVAAGECGLEFSPSDGARRTTIADLLGTVRWSASRLRRFRMLGGSAMGIDDALGRSYQSFLTALGRESLNWR